MDMSIATEPFILVSEPHPKSVEGFPLDSLSVDIATGEYYYDFPETMPLELTLNDLLEENVDEKYYLKGATIDRFLDEIKERLNTHTHTGSGLSVNHYP